MKKYYYNNTLMCDAKYQITGRVLEKETGILLPTDILNYAKTFKTAEHIMEWMKNHMQFYDLQIMPVPNSHQI
jgi:hypothetical protein